MPRNPKIEFDELQMYFGYPYVIDTEDSQGTVTVYSPTIGDIMAIGESKFYQTLNIFICNTTQYRALLWDIGIDWNQFTDFQLFVMLYKQADPDVTKLLFGDLDFSKFEPLMKHKNEEDEEGELILWNNDVGVEINANVHNHFSQYLRAVFGITPEEKFTDNQTLKEWYITKDKRATENAKKMEQKKGKTKTTSGMKAVISSLINHPGFKYKLQELKQVGVAEFYDSVKRLQVYEQSIALMRGMYSGFVDGSKIKPEDYNFMREI